MKNITVSVDDEIYRKARMRAAEEGISLSRVVRDNLVKFVSEPSEAEKGNAEREAFYRAIDAQFAGLSGDALYPGWRDDLYDTARENEPTGAARAA